jgi:hypothetical protein
MTTTILIFTLAVIFRALSGFQNGFGYARSFGGISTATSLMIFTNVFVLWWFAPVWYAAIFLALSAAASFYMVRVLIPTIKFNEIHNTEAIITGAFITALFFIDWRTTWVPILFAHYPAMLLHKIGVNVPPTNTAWNHNGTNDPTGETVKIFNLDWWRTSFNARLALAAISIVGFFLWLLW